MYIFILIFIFSTLSSYYQCPQRGFDPSRTLEIIILFLFCLTLHVSEVKIVYGSEGAKKNKRTSANAQIRIQTNTYVKSSGKERPMRPFKEKKLNAQGNVLPCSEFRLFSDMEKVEFTPERMAPVIAKAESFLDTPIPILPASVYREYKVNGNRTNYETPFFLRRDMAAYLAHAEAYEKKGRFTEKLMDAVWAIMEESSWVIPAHHYNNPVCSYQDYLPPVYGNNYCHGIDLFAGTTGGMLAFVYYIAKDALDGIAPIICEKMKYMLRERIIRPFLELTPWWGGERGNRVNNWNPWIISNVLTVTALTEESTVVREQVVNKVMDYLDNFISWYKDDGGCDEGPSYWGAAGASLFDCLELIEDISGGRLTIYDTDIVRNIAEYIYKVNIDGTNYVNFADCPPKVPHSPSMLVRLGKKCNSEFLTNFGKKQAAFGDYCYSSWHFYRALKDMCSPVLKPENCPMPLCSYLSDLKVMTARETTDTAKGTFLAAKGGNNDEMHNHNDVGNFIIYRDGKPVLIDTGVGTYTKQTFSPERYQIWFMQSGYHNLPSFGGIDQHVGAQYASSDEVFDESIPSFRSELAAAYPAETGVKSYVRSVRLDGGKVTVSDSFELNEEKDVVFHYMTARLPVRNADGSISLPEGMRMTYTDGYACEIEEFDPIGMNTKAQWGTEKLYRIKLSTRAARGSITVTVE